MQLIDFDNLTLVPDRWRDRAGSGPIWAFNPSIHKIAGGWLFAYRLIFEDQRRRIALCRLSSGFAVVPGSIVPVSDLLTIDGPCETERTWFADPRLFRAGGKLWLYWNTGWHQGPNSQFMQELDAATFLPRGTARVMELEGARQTIEKNWMLFGEDTLRAVYSPCGQVILESSEIREGEIRFRELIRNKWDCTPYSARFGDLRGGAPPVRRGDSYYCFCHSISGVAGNYEYVTAVYRFSAEPPYRVTHSPVEPIPIGGESFRMYPPLNPAIERVTYPAGAAWHEGTWVVSYGVNDERCRVAVMSEEEVDGCICEISGA